MHFKCEICSYVVLEEKELLSHMTQAHSDRYSVCKRCRRCFWDDLELERHMSTHFFFRCNVCHQRFDSAGSLKSHERSSHSAHCHLCSRAFDDVSELLRQDESSHISRGDEGCTSCLQNAQGRESHARLYNAEPRFTCTICGATFSFLFELKYHENACCP